MTAAVSPTLQDLGWDPGWATAFLPFDAAGWRPARVVAAHRDAWVVATPAGDLDAVIAGRLRHEALGPADLPAVGDWVAVGHGGSAAIDAESDAMHAEHANGSGPTVIQAVLPRRTAFGRSTADSGRRTGSRAADEQVLAANVDVALVVTSLDGDFNLRRLERYLAVAWTGGATPVIVLNKADVADDAAGLQVAAEAVAPGVEVRTISALTGDGVAALADDHLPPGRTAVVLGSSGVGKSTLVNALLGYSACEPAPSARTTRAAATPPPIASSSGCPPARCSSTPQASARSASPARRTVSRPRSPTSPTSPWAASSATAAMTASRDAPSGPRSTTAASTRPGSRAIASWSARRPTSPANPTRSPWPPSDAAGRRSTPRWPSR